MPAFNCGDFDSEAFDTDCDQYGAGQVIQIRKEPLPSPTVRKLKSFIGLWQVDGWMLLNSEKELLLDKGWVVHEAQNLLESTGWLLQDVDYTFSVQVPFGISLSRPFKVKGSLLMSSQSSLQTAGKVFLELKKYLEQIKIIKSLKLNPVQKQQSKKRPKFSKLANVLKEQLDDFIKKYKRMPTQKELSLRIEKVRTELKKELHQASENLFKKMYTDATEEVEKEIGFNFAFGKRDEQAVKTLANQKVLSESFSGLSQQVAGKLQDILIDTYQSKDGINFQELQKRIAETAEIADSHAELIARTETSKVSAAARRNSYFQAYEEHELKFKHVGIQDNRTTRTCRAIRDRTKQGVSWQEYLSILKEESNKDFPDWTVDDEFPVAHFSCRHTFVAVPRE